MIPLLTSSHTKETRQDQRLVRSASSNRVDFEPSEHGLSSTHMHELDNDSRASFRETAEQFSLHNSSRSGLSQTERNFSVPSLGLLARGMTESVSRTHGHTGNISDIKHNEEST